jgi:hypothetical protein
MTAFLNGLQGSALVVALVLVPAALVLSLLVFWKRFVRKRNRRSPLTSELLRPPGFGLQERIEDLTHDINSDLASIMLVPLMILGTYQIQIQANTLRNPRVVGVLLLLTGVVIVAFLAVKLFRRVDVRQIYREALAGELATAQLLEPVLANGGRLLHDIQAPGFNIDHVVVSPGGVFAVETKHRLKPTQGNAKDQARVTFDGKVLHFPDWKETKPIEQARAQARWLSERLTKSTGLSVQARPVVALPGWFVDCRAPSDVAVTNPKSWQFLLRPRRNEPGLESDAIQRIAFQVEQLCRMPASEESRRVGQSQSKDQGRSHGQSADGETRLLR